jgi:hypothetical protein
MISSTSLELFLLYDKGKIKMTEETEDKDTEIIVYRLMPYISDAEIFEDSTDPEFFKRCQEIADCEFKKDRDIIDTFIEHLKETEESEE